MGLRHCVAAAAAALLTASLTACDGTTESNDPQTTPPTVSWPTDPYHAPSVPDPIQADAFVEKPCTSLTPDQQKKFNVDSGEADSVGGAAGVVVEVCAYHHTNVDRSIRIDYTPEGLHGPKQVDLPPDLRWDLEALDNYPAIGEYTVDESGVPSVPPSCYYRVGLNDTLYFGVLAQDTNGDSVCTLAREIATDVLSNIKKPGESPH